MGTRFRVRMIGPLALAAFLAAVPASAPADTVCLDDGLVATSANVSQVEVALACDVNAYRVANGVPALAMDSRLMSAARGHSLDMTANGYFGHIDLNGGDPSGRAAAAGYPAGAGENIAGHSNVSGALGRGTAYYLFGQWRGSAGHNANMLGSDYVATGLGLAAVYRPSSAAAVPGLTGTQMFGLVPADGSITGLAGQVGPAPGNPFPGYLSQAGGNGGAARLEGGSEDHALARAKRKCKRKKKSRAKRRRCIRRAAKKLKRASRV